MAEKKGKKTKGRSVGALDEFKLIEQLVGKAQAGGSLALGVGDDAALLCIGEEEEAVVTTDIVAEGVHFSVATISPSDLGRKAFHVNLSDLAAMGARPLAMFLSVALPKETPLPFVKAFYNAFKRESKKYEAPIAGGDTTASTGGIFISVTALGVVKKGRALRRDASKRGDGVFLVGDIGLSLAGFMALEAGKDGFSSLKKAHRRPRAQIEAGRFLAESGIRAAAIDISDGLLGDISHILQQSEVGARLWASALSPKPALKRYCESHGLDCLEMMLDGGEDYALLFTCRADSFFSLSWPEGIAKPKQIGEITKEKGLWLEDGEGCLQSLKPKGFRHFG